MLASVYTQYGPPEVLQLKDVPKPIPKNNEVLVKIHATTVNRTDTGFRVAEYFAVRIVGGLFKPKKTILGSEFAGRVESIGKDVTLFKPGDPVFGLSAYVFGTHAEYVCVPENKSIAIKPTKMSFEEAAAVCDGLILGINYIRKIDFKNKPKILINGASGSIGSACVQLAHHYGAEITAVCNTKNLSLVKSLGADEVIDYTQQDFTNIGKLYDVVLDAVGKSTFFKCKKILKPGGVYFSTELGPGWQNVFLPLITPLLGSKRVKFPIPTDSKEDILLFKELIEAGKYKAVIDRTYPLKQIMEATRYVETGQKTGNVVIKVQDIN
ncbi:MAG TPA: NAD(P)-dependent alcohol dehydrogenase [Cyclobacteriaceae bacterium]|nr:NAD(P)-dependent alcohol dehydrogenase [Cyclobacteriaceae bacterium]HPW63221.1 NAD(P)-dependent alcohol dehydrogenase [Cyclobacteriaceae bacterium]HRG79670.1 NAD(P)-dependent alcohol dehydrogenase [Cyclobacteriaceae bacterium]